jgi:hypothetical protein
MYPQKAGQKPVITKPLTILETRRKSAPLIKRVNNPRVTILIGSVIRMIRGLKKALIIPNTKAIIRTVAVLETSMPFTMCATIKIDNALIPHLTKKYII